MIKSTELAAYKICFMLLLMLTLLWSCLIHAEMQFPANSDVRVLIDISGSMKKNDPENLRRPALNLITELLPDGHSAGVWTFGQNVNALVAYQKVDAKWRELARQKSSEISSVALFTNIGAALEKSSEDLKADSQYENTHFILLTDGVVDISKTPGANVTERERILTEVLPRFKAMGAKIHTVALSKNADLTLLQNISVATDGIYALAETSDELSKVFLQALQTAAPAEEVPIKDNAFNVDSSIEEFTALIFRADDKTETAIVEPTGERFTYEQRPEYVRWFREVGYDLITVARPLEGEWKLEAELQPGSRVTVVSNLKMVMEPLPSNFYAGDQLEIKVGFFEDGEQVLNSSFLGLVSVDITVKTEDGKSGTKRISQENGPPADGVFREKISRLKDVGRYEVTALGDGRTFKRQVRQLITLNSPMAVDLEATGTGDDTRYRVVVSALSDNIDTEKTSIISKVKGPEGSNLIKSVPYNPEADRWELEVDPVRGDGIYTLNLRVEGVTKTNGKFRLDPEDIVAEFPRQEASPNEYRSLVDPEDASTMNEVLAEEAIRGPEPAEPPVEDIIPPLPAEVVAQAQEEQAAAAEDAPEVEKPGSRKRTIMYIVGAVGAGVVVLSLLGLGIWTWRKKKAEESMLAQRVSSGTKEARTLAPEPEVDESKAESDLEDEIEQLENPVMEAPEDLDLREPEAPIEEGPVDSSDTTEEDADDMEFSLEEPEIPEPTVAEPEADDSQENLEEEEFSVDDVIEQAAEKVPDPSEANDAEKSAEELADEILKSNQAAADADDEFNLEDFDISDTDDLPASDDDDKK